MVDDAITVAKTGAIISVTGTSARVAIPVASDGNIPRYIRIAANAAAYVALGDVTVTAVAGDLLVQPADCVIVATQGRTHVAGIQVSAAGTVQISPLEGI